MSRAGIAHRENAWDIFAVEPWWAVPTMLWEPRSRGEVRGNAPPGPSVAGEDFVVAVVAEQNHLVVILAVAFHAG